jgi:hypothetical protein
VINKKLGISRAGASFFDCQIEKREKTVKKNINAERKNDNFGLAGCLYHA